MSRRQMTPKERILAAIEHKQVDRIPTDYWGTFEAMDKLMKGLGAKDPAQLWKMLDMDKVINVGSPYIGPELKVEGDTWSDYWGIKYKPVSYGDNLGVYHEMCSHPLEGFETIDEIEANYTWPSADWFDYAKAAEECTKYPDYAVEAGYMAPFYMYTNLRGIEGCLMDLAADEELAAYIIQKLCDFQYEFHKRLFESCQGKIDITQVTDDFGTQTGLMISLGMFDKYFKSPYQRFIGLTKSHGIKVFHHDDGSIMQIVPKLVELGIEVLNPIQWHLPGMDLKELKERFGKQLCFHGGVDNQHVLPFGTVEEVRREALTCLEVLASDGTGYIFAPCHNVQANTPVENVVAMYKAAEEFSGR